MKRLPSATPPSRRLPRGEAGYTLIEALVILVIMSIIAGFAIPKLDWTTYRVNSEVRNMVMQLAYAQRLAVSLQHNVLVTVDPDARRLIVDEDKNNDGVYTSDERRRVIQLDDGVTFARNGAPDLPAPNPTTELTTITYRRDGSASSSGVIFMNSLRGINRGTNANSRALAIVRATGRAFWFSYASGTWQRMN
jgi:Tfp pilus assembly protein FimT